MTKVTLEKIVMALESGSRPKGGVGQIASGALSLGAEHLDGNGGFYLESPKYVPHAFYSQLSKGKVCKDDILIVKDGATTGKVSFVDGLFDGKDVSINEHVFRLAVKPDRAEPRYVFHYLSSPQGKSEILSDFRGATVGGISRGFISRVKIPLPSLPEQRRIATILDKADAIRRKRRQAIDLMNDFLRSVFLEMFGDVGSSRESFSYQPLGNLLLKIDSGKSPVCLAEIAESEQWGVLKLSAVTSNVFKPDENKALPPSEEPNPNYEVKEGDLLFTRKNTYDLVGACALVLKTRGRLLLPDLIFRLVIDPSKQILPSFLWGVLTSPSYRQKIKNLAGGTAGSMPNISKARLETLDVPTPSMDLQGKYDRIVRQTFKTIEVLEEALLCTDDLLKSLSSECLGS